MATKNTETDKKKFLNRSKEEKERITEEINHILNTVPPEQTRAKRWEYDGPPKDLAQILLC